MIGWSKLSAIDDHVPNRAHRVVRTDPCRVSAGECGLWAGRETHLGLSGLCLSAGYRRGVCTLCEDGNFSNPSTKFNTADGNFAESLYAAAIK